MNFNTPEYAVFLFLVFWIYWKCPSNPLRLQVLLLSSYVFYAAWNPKYLVLIVFSTLLDFLVGLGLGRCHRSGARKLLLFTSVAGNLAVLGVFKYFNFFVTEVLELLHTLGFDYQPPHLRLLLPVGISFYTFQTLSYTIDVYREKIAPTGDFVRFATFVAFFPQLVAGPILRASQFLPQMGQARRYDAALAMDGVHRILRGLAKKAVFADLVGFMIVDKVFASPSSFSALEVMIALYGYSLQIYADFSGYSDIAIGTAQLLGYRIPENFRHPFLACNCRELWQRWHISLSSWLRDYLYLPLGGSRRGRGRTYINLMITMLLGGLWHGAGVTFLIWGAIQGGALALTRSAQRRPREQDRSAHWRVWSGRFLTFNFFSLGWILFRAEDLHVSLDLMGSLAAGSLSLSGRFNEFGLALIVVGLGVHFGHGGWKEAAVRRFAAQPAIVQAIVAFLVICVVGGTARYASPFIYFQF